VSEQLRLDFEAAEKASTSLETRSQDFDESGKRIWHKQRRYRNQIDWILEVYYHRLKKFDYDHEKARASMIEDGYLTRNPKHDPTDPNSLEFTPNDAKQPWAKKLRKKSPNRSLHFNSSTNSR
jgi:hypothetical protein|tara:strand:+ start:2907 stop:3275 length:369 start_codon:yes stop_codon:yes gene_type:complete